MGEGITLREFRQVLDSIIDASVEENGGSRRMIEDEINHVEVLYKMMKKGKHGPQITDILAQCDGFINEWESSGRISAAVQQLIALLNRPHIRSVILAAHDISNGRYSPELPPVPFEVDDDDGIAVKIVKLVKKGNGTNGIGVTIKKDSKGRIVIARILSESIAERSGCIQEGDRIIEVNGTNVTRMDPSEIGEMLNELDNGCVTLKMHPSESPHSNNASVSNIHLRALIDYDGDKDGCHPCPESAISFTKGDIIELIMCGDEYWWQARNIGRGSFAGNKDVPTTGDVNHRIGLIPSESLLMKRKLGGTIGKRRDYDVLGTLRSLSSKSSRELEDGPPYESVCQLSPSLLLHPRPILLIGAPTVGRNELKRRLCTLFPKRFASTVPHTTRPQRENELNGVQYHFVSRSKMEDMISKGEMMEFGEFKGNLYGTALSAINHAAKKGIPLLTPHPLALRSLRSSRFIPFIIFIKPPSRKEFISSRASVAITRGRPFSEAEIDSIIENSQSISRSYGAFFDAEVVNGDIEIALADVTRLIDYSEKISSWVPLSWSMKEEENTMNDRKKTNHSS